MWGCGLIYCQQELTDGFIPAQIIETFGVKAPNKRKVATELCTPKVPGKKPLWKEVEGGYQVNDYLDWNDSRALVLKRREGSKARQQRFRQTHDASEHNADSNAVSLASHNSLQTALPLLGVTRLVTPLPRGTYSTATNLQYHGSTIHGSVQELTSEYSADKAGAPQATAGSRTPTLWTRALAIAHRVVEDYPNDSHNWGPELKARMLNQGIDANDQGQKRDKGKFFQRVLAACIEQRKFRSGDGGVIEHRWRRRARETRRVG